jgi:quercetin dioxygenase-like cupin family protein
MVMENGQKSMIGPGHFVVHPRNTVHGLRNISQDNFVYIALSTGD